jgi:NAD(P)-dependent dehydrogenase (short-subunit alcohol dehydrogenase family)
MFETNFWGTVRVIQTLIPSMRTRKSGTIVNISSSTFWNPPPGAAMYAASKFAMEGLSEALAVELSAFNVRVLTVQPGAMKTAFYDPNKMKLPALHEGYKGTPVDFVLKMFGQMNAVAPQDPAKTADAIVKEVLKPVGSPPVSKLPLGKESLGAIRKRAEGSTQVADQVESVAVTCDF